MGLSCSPLYPQCLAQRLAHSRAHSKFIHGEWAASLCGGGRPVPFAGGCLVSLVSSEPPLPFPCICVPDRPLLSPWRCAEAPGTRGGVRVHPAQCLRALHPHHPLGGAWRKSQHQLRQDGVLSNRDIPHEAFLRRESAQVGSGQGDFVPVAMP